MKRVLVCTLIAPLLLLAPGVAAAAGRATPVVLIMMENHNYEQIVGNNNAPYLNRRFIPSGTLYTHYRAISHPSLPNYLALTSGTTSGCHTDDCPRQRFRTNNIFHQLMRAGLHWRAYEEGMPSTCLLHDAGRYAVHHNPPAYYRDLMGRPCRKGDIPYPRSNKPLKAFTFVTPNMCNDMHSCSVGVGDEWLRKHVPPFIQAGAIVVITFDEGSGSNHVVTAVSGPRIRARMHDHVHFSHYGLLAGIEAHFGLPRLHHAKTARPIRLR